MPPERDSVEGTTASRPQAATAALVPTATAVGADRAEVDGRRTVGRKREGSGSLSSMRTAKQQKTSAGDGTSAFQAGAVSDADGAQDSGLSAYERVSAVVMAPVSGDQERSSTEVRMSGDTHAEGSHRTEIEVSRILKRFEDALKKAEETPQKVMNLQKKLDLAEHEAKTAGIRADEAAKRETRNREEHAKLLQESDEQNKKLSKEHEKLQAEYKEMSESKHKLFVENMTRRITNESFAEAMKDFSIAEEKLKQATKDKTDLAEKLRQAETARGEADNELARLKETLTSTEAERDSVDAALAATRETVTSTEAERDSAMAELDKMREKLTSTEAERDSATAELAAARQTVTSTEAERDSAKAELDKVREMLASTEADLHLEKADVSSLEERLSSEVLEAQLDTAADGRSDWEKTVDLAASRLKTLTPLDDGMHHTYRQCLRELTSPMVSDDAYKRILEHPGSVEPGKAYCLTQVVLRPEDGALDELPESNSMCTLHTAKDSSKYRCVRVKCVVQDGTTYMILGRRTR
ncbi:hypothetical protein GCG54_00002614 [Colletotrichum gloeosporioides]|uniref:Uncharacterized protein n=1 Tax=Colletotrichum gloeosporioides TaxID=474922 RepID=A0A8H4CUP0_COLGL|nr:uncharacterized protein GCG54_00002614 [Colletotrichum gloeosporioides]KAF3810162.1 hypothetical protein GCG54_00002614 [Colletotrichum gloeosporioides]